MSALSSISIYTPAQDAEINRLRLAGVTWADIAVHLGFPRDRACCMRQRARTARMACCALTRAYRPQAQRPPQPRMDAGPDPLPAMHPLAWAVLVEARV